MLKTLVLKTLVLTCNRGNFTSFVLLWDLQEDNILSAHPPMYPFTLFYWDFITLIPTLAGDGELDAGKLSLIHPLV